MQATIPNLWPTVSAPDVLSPIFILRHQASLLRQTTKGLLEAQVKISEDRKYGRLWCGFEIIAPQLDRYSFELFRTGQEIDNPYPIEVYSTGLITELSQNPLMSWALHPNRERESADDDEHVVVASTQDEFIQILTILLASRRTRSVIDSLLARTNDLRIFSEDEGTGDA